MKITEKMKSILESWTFEGNIYKMPQVDRKDYQEVNKVLESLGGKWKTRVWHIFTWTQEELENALQEVLEIWETITLDEIKKQFQYYPTPESLAEKIVELSNISDWDEILEPSAWRWAILDKIIDYQVENNRIFAIELKEDNYEYLEENYKITWIANIDFLEHNSKSYDKIIMNPPFSKSQDVKHILHWYSLLEEWGRLVSIASNSVEFRTGKVYEELRSLNPEIIKIDEWAFKESWTMVNTVIIILNK